MKRGIIIAAIALAIGIAAFLAFASARPGNGLASSPPRRQAAQEQSAEELGRAPAPGELVDAHRPLMVALSPAGDCLAVSTQMPNNEILEIWRMTSGVGSAALRAAFPVGPQKRLVWHPSRNQIALGGELGYKLVDIDKHKVTEFGGAPPTGALAWLPGSDWLLLHWRDAGEKPGALRLYNARTGKTKAFDSWIREVVVDEIAVSGAGDFAVAYCLFPEEGSRHEVALYPKAARGHRRSVRKVILESDRASTGVIATPRIIRWLQGGRLVYAMVSPGATANTYRYELWTCNSDASDRRRWFVINDVQGSYGLARYQLSVSANGKRVAFLRGNRVFVFDSTELERSSMGGLSGTSLCAADPYQSHSRPLGISMPCK